MQCYTIVAHKIFTEKSFELKTSKLLLMTGTLRFLRFGLPKAKFIARVASQILI